MNYNRLIACGVAGSGIALKNRGIIGASGAQSGVDFDKDNILCYYQFCEASGDLINKATLANGFDDGLGNAQDGTVGSGVTYGASGIIRSEEHNV